MSFSSTVVYVRVVYKNELYDTLTCTLLYCVSKAHPPQHVQSMDYELL